MRPSDTHHLVTLVGCGKAKLTGTHAAGELYRGTPTRARLAAAREAGGDTFIVSARHGLLELDRQVTAYDTCLDDFTAAQRTRWARLVSFQVAEHLHAAGTFGAATVRILAGRCYSAPLTEALEAMGVATVA